MSTLNVMFYNIFQYSYFMHICSYVIINPKFAYTQCFLFNFTSMLLT